MQNIAITVSEKLKSLIDTGSLHVNDKLPSETEMAKKFNVSRETYRAAIRILEKDGKVRTKHGIGTFILKPLPKIENKIDELWSIGKMITNAGFKEEECQEVIEVVPCENEVAEALLMDEGDAVVRLQRFRIANGEAVAYSINYMSYALVGHELECDKFKGSLFDFLQENCNLEISCADTEFIIPEEEDPYIEKIGNGGTSKIVLLKQLHYSTANEPVLYSYDYLRNDIFRFRIRRMMKK